MVLSRSLSSLSIRSLLLSVFVLLGFDCVLGRAVFSFLVLILFSLLSLPFSSSAALLEEKNRLVEQLTSHSNTLAIKLKETKESYDKLIENIRWGCAWLFPPSLFVLLPFVVVGVFRFIIIHRSWCWLFSVCLFFLLQTRN
jgi:hypothetical protein